MIKPNVTSVISTVSKTFSGRNAEWSIGCGAIDEARYLRPGRVTTIFSRNRRTNTALAVEIALRASLTANSRLGVLVLTPLVSASDYLTRMASVMSGINVWKLNRGLLKSERDEIERLYNNAAVRLSSANLLVEDSPDIDPDGLAAALKATDPEFHLGLVVVDCLQDFGYRIEGAAGWSSLGCRLKRIAVAYDVPVLVFSGTSSDRIELPDVYDGYGCLQDYVDHSLQLALQRTDAGGNREFLLNRIGAEDHEPSLTVFLDPKTERIKVC